MKDYEPNNEDKVLVAILLIMVFLFGIALGVAGIAHSIAMTPENASHVSDEWSDVMDLSVPFKIRGGTPTQRQTIREAFDMLPDCEHDVLDRRLHVVVLHPVKQATPGETTWGGSFGFGLMELDSKQLHGQVLQRVFLHESGHFFDWQYHISDDPRFVKALAGDFAILSHKKQYENHYIKNPKEAMAEMFSFRFTQRFYFDTPFYYNIESFPDSYTIFSEDLDNDCKETP